jgi:hypothetical protein
VMTAPDRRSAAYASAKETGRAGAFIRKLALKKG